ncbi:hypothetical protein EVJ58_g8542 [Rhodofomes roseus]|uniref:Uncharacterized protein n=1 Tax=Rhodofomes roseus TaxID=34475 RepID=A0A4Y9XXT9_9APHY|nr:hypothetical protein EVJ58_g8542 [Rhodofomes roseus]
MAPTEFSLRLQHGTTPSPLIVCIELTYPSVSERRHHRRLRASHPQRDLHHHRDTLPARLEHHRRRAPRRHALPVRRGAQDALRDRRGGRPRSSASCTGILKSIPTEQPPGSEDIYGLDTSIAFGSDDLMWMNGGPAGCGTGRSTVQATEEDKAKFKRAVKIVQELLEKAA